jgi:hypothetical protein
MEQVRPRDHHHHDEDLGLERDGRIVEDLHSRQSGLTGLFEQFV